MDLNAFAFVDKSWGLAREVERDDETKRWSYIKRFRNDGQFLVNESFVQCFPNYAIAHKNICEYDDMKTGAMCIFLTFGTNQGDVTDDSEQSVLWFNSMSGASEHGITNFLVGIPVNDINAVAKPGNLRGMHMSVRRPASCYADMFPMARTVPRYRRIFPRSLMTPTDDDAFSKLQTQIMTRVLTETEYEAHYKDDRRAASAIHARETAFFTITSGEKITGFQVDRDGDLTYVVRKHLLSGEVDEAQGSLLSARTQIVRWKDQARRSAR
jgi:hypothetical protein